ncbi:hypothetical protein Hanom_Chr10g00937551 [Helianthus anomalus]
MAVTSSVVHWSARLLVLLLIGPREITKFTNTKADLRNWSPRPSLEWRIMDSNAQDTSFNHGMHL